MSTTDHRSLTSIMRVLLLLTLLVAAPALAQPPDTLHLPPCEIAALGDAGPELLRGRWLRLDINPLTMLSLIDSTALDELDEIAKNVAPFPLDDFVSLVLSGLGSGKSQGDIARDIAGKHALDYEYDIDPELLYIGIDILQPVAFANVVLIEMSEKKSDNVVVATLQVRSRDGVETDLSIVGDPLLARKLRAVQGGSSETVIVQKETRNLWSEMADSIAVNSQIESSGSRGLRVFRILPLNHIDQEFYYNEKATVDALRDAVLPPWDRWYPLPWMFFHILNIRVGNPLYSHEEFMREVTSSLCSIQHYPCESHYDFTDSATWRRIDTAFRETLHRYHALPRRFYAVIADDTVSAFIAFANDTTRTRPIILTRDEMEATPAMRGTDWHERLMRSIREEECWAERMEGF